MIIMLLLLLRFAKALFSFSLHDICNCYIVLHIKTYQERSCFELGYMKNFELLKMIVIIIIITIGPCYNEVAVYHLVHLNAKYLDEIIYN